MKDNTFSLHFMPVICIGWDSQTINLHLILHSFHTSVSRIVFFDAKVSFVFRGNCAFLVMN